MNELQTGYVLKSGNGRLWGVSNNKEQPGKTLTIFDGDVVLCIANLDEAFPMRTVLVYGVEEVVPGLVVDMMFVTNLRVETEGEGIDIHWF